MTIQVYWDESEELLVRWDMEEGWSLSDFRYALKQTREMTEETTGWFDLIINAHQTQPPNFPMVDFQRALAEASPRLDLLLVCNANMFARLLLESLRRMNVPNTNRNKMIFSETLEDAQKYVRDRRTMRVTSDAPTQNTRPAGLLPRTGRLTLPKSASSNG